MKRTIAILMTLLFMLGMSSFAGTGFVDGFNETAGLFNLETSYFYEETDGWVIIKVTDDWVTNHWTWYTDELLTEEDCLEIFENNPMDDFILHTVNEPFGDGVYRYENFLKLKFVDSNEVDGLLAAGYALGTFDGDNYFIFAMNILMIYEDDEIIAEYDLITYEVNPGLGNDKR